MIEVAEKYLRKGSEVYIEGQIETRKWSDKDGQERYTTEIRADRMQMLGSRQGQGGPSASDSQSDYQPPAAKKAAAKPSFDEKRKHFLWRFWKEVPGMGGMIDGVAGDHIQISPPYIFNEANVEQLIRALEAAMDGFQVGLPLAQPTTQAAVDELLRDRLMLPEDADRYLEKARNEARVIP